MTDTQFVLIVIGFVVAVHLAYLCWATSLPQDVWRWIRDMIRKG